METTASEKAMIAAIGCANRGEWPEAILCILFRDQQLDGQAMFDAREIQQKLSELGFEWERVDIKQDLRALVELGLLGVARVDSPDELGT